MLDVGSASADNGEDDLAIFVDRLAAAGPDEATAAAKAQVRAAVLDRRSPPGLRRLAEALAASVTELPPPRRPSEDSTSVVAAMRGNPLVVLEDFDAAAVATSVAALLADGRRVVVTAATPAELAAVREALPEEAAERAVDALPALPAAELRELRRLLATSTPARRARSTQQLPGLEMLPPVREVDVLCARSRQSAGEGPVAVRVPALLADLDPARREAVTSVAQCVGRSLGAMHALDSGTPWSWVLLEDLIYGRHRPSFDQMLEDTAQAVSALDHARQSSFAEVTGPLPPGAVDILRRYRDFLAGGGRSRAYFRSPAQREVAPVLRLVRVDGRVPETDAQVRRIIEHIELGQRLARIDAGCAELGIEPPRDEAELVRLAEVLVKVAAAARSVGALRHDVLFISPMSPLAVPDVGAAEEVARAILEYAEHGSAEEAKSRLTRFADDLAARAPAGAVAPEHQQAVDALRACDVHAYAAAVEALAAARGEAMEEQRKSALLNQLAERSPTLATALSIPGERTTVFSLAWFVPMESLLKALPPADSADVVVIIGASGLGVERLLLTAVAPRMIAAVAPDGSPDEAPSLLSVLRRASALVIRGRVGTTGNVVRLEPGSRPKSVPAAGA